MTTSPSGCMRRSGRRARLVSSNPPTPHRPFSQRCHRRINTGVTYNTGFPPGTCVALRLRPLPCVNFHWTHYAVSAARRLDSLDHARTTRPRENQETTRSFVDVNIEQTNKRLLCLSEVDLQLLCLSEVDLLLIWSFFLMCMLLP